jgi:DNA phosphorothioation-dependent restriction protein DptG
MTLFSIMHILNYTQHCIYLKNSNIFIFRDFDQMGRSIQPDYLTTRSQCRCVLNETLDGDIEDTISGQNKL